MSSPSATTLAAGEGFATATSLGVGEDEGGVVKGCATATSGGGGGATSTTLTSLATFGALQRKIIAKCVKVRTQKLANMYAAARACARQTGVRTLTLTR